MQDTMSWRPLLELTFTRVTTGQYARFIVLRRESVVLPQPRDFNNLTARARKRIEVKNLNRPAPRVSRRRPSRCDGWCGWRHIAERSAADRQQAIADRRRLTASDNISLGR